MIREEVEAINREAGSFTRQCKEKELIWDELGDEDRLVAAAAAGSAAAICPEPVMRELEAQIKKAKSQKKANALTPVSSLCEFIGKSRQTHFIPSMLLT